jgi:hypothetical protein
VAEAIGRAHAFCGTAEAGALIQTAYRTISPVRLGLHRMLRSVGMATTEESGMATISRYEFMGSWFYFWALCITGVGLPLAFLYLLNGTVRVEEQVEDGERVMSALRSAR